MTFSDVVDLVVAGALHVRHPATTYADDEAGPIVRRAYNDAIERACEAGWSELAVRQRRERRRVVTVAVSRGGDA